MPVYQPQGRTQESNNFEPFEPGYYELMVTDAVYGAFSNNNGYKVDFTYEVVADPEHNGKNVGRKVFDLVALEHPNMEWAGQTQARLDALCAIGNFPALEDWSQLINLRVRAKIYIEKSKDPQYSDKNKIDIILPLENGAGTAAPQMAVPGAAPAGGVPAAGGIPGQQQQQQQPPQMGVPGQQPAQGGQAYDDDIPF